MNLTSLLPAPVQPIWDRDDDKKLKLASRSSTALVSAQTIAPPYGQRRGWVPRNVTDYGDGGAFPEIHVAQYPLNMGCKGKESTSNAIAVQLNAEGKVKYDVLARQGHSKDKIVYSKLSDLLPTEVVTENDPSLEKASQEEIEENTERTRLALMKITNSKIAAAMPVRCAERQGPAEFIRYTPSQQGAAYNSGAKQRVIRLVEAQVDPMEPPRFKINKKIPRGPPSPPAPVLHSPTRRVTVKEQKDWKIPPCISNWKNAKGYTVPLDKRLAADGRGLQQLHINEKFAKLAEALYIADRKAREAVETRAQLEKKLAQKEKEQKEEHLRQLAQRARDERAGIRVAPTEKPVDDEERERDMLRQDRHKERARERNLSRAAPDKRSKLQRERERDISEQIALGMPARGVQSGEMQFDQRLFGQAKGLGQGYNDDEGYNVYDKPWREGGSLANHLYRPSKNIDKDVYGEDLEKIVKSNRFVPDKEFNGTDHSATASRAGPVQFEKEEDPFGLDQFLSQAKRASKRKEPERRDDRDKKKRRD